MPSIINDFKGANKYFDGNKRRVAEKHPELVGKFENIYNEIVKNPPPVSISAERGTALALQYRALKFLYSAFRLVLEGHTHEARVLSRNTLELRIVALDIGFNKRTYDSWRLAQSEKEKLKKRDGGIIDSNKLKKALKDIIGNSGINDLKFEASFKRAKENRKTKNRVKQIIKDHGITSEYWSHENIFNLVRRIDIKKNKSGTETTEIYMGYDANSKIEPFLQIIIEDLRRLYEDIQFVSDTS